MCGIVGFNSSNFEGAEPIIMNMTALLSHRGPDDHGHWLDHRVKLAFGHTRLSIVDLSPEGHQPMGSESGRYIIVYNGEVYNYPELGHQLASLGHTFRGHSDTEVILAAIEEWGLEASIKKFVGMFAFALWDRKEEALHLVRDRLGIKPLYYGWTDTIFLFTSELKPLFGHPNFAAPIDRNALKLFMELSYIPTPHTIYRGIYKLWPGSILTLAGPDIYRKDFSFSPFPQNEEAQIRPRQFWSAKEAASRIPSHLTDAESIDHLERLLKQAISLRMLADVPLGAFLSGGVDSSTTVALMQSLCSKRVRTFSIGFHEKSYNEAPFAAQVAKHLGTDHTELYLTPSETLSVVPLLPTLYDEPFADSSQIPTYLVSKLARQYVTVSLSGDGGDELFGGYDRYFRGNQLWRLLKLMPLPFRHILVRALTAPDIKFWEGVFRIFGNGKALARKVSRLAHLLKSSDRVAFYRSLVSTGHFEDNIVLKSEQTQTVFSKSQYWPKHYDFLPLMMFIDLISYLPDDLLTKVDRASMAVSLEARVPILDHRVVEFALSLPLHRRIRHGKSKWALRQVLYHHVPSHLIERPKMGFAIPIEKWLLGELRPWAENLLDSRNVKVAGYLNERLVSKRWQEFKSGNNRFNHYIWNILTFQAWQQERSPTRAQPISNPTFSYSLSA